MRSRIVSLVLVIILLLVHSGIAFAAPARDRGVATEVGLGIGSFALSIFYSPAKIVYSAFGATIGGLAYAVTMGNSEIALGIIEPACRGTYIITPAILTGQEKLEFVGPTSRRQSTTQTGQ
ncbi:MAG: hypothetical protein A3G93_06790 [Nitrospinae bacterium RIFCSPLOWO2_12_FULL_45_22]|nr:MAG: hypothetical protein A3G93_06790 [Nitrospinae bacterium RIFCSPLOWO2_12_FULL_45_22]